MFKVIRGYVVGFFAFFVFCYILGIDAPLALAAMRDSIQNIRMSFSIPSISYNTTTGIEITD